MADDDFVSFVLDQLSRLPGIRHRRMFGATGLYQGELFFAIVDDGRLYFRTDDGSRPDYESRGMKAFRPKPDQVLKNYYEVPVDVLEDDTVLCEWARRAVAAQETRDPRRKRAK
jgi:DNA transformation protein